MSNRMQSNDKSNYKIRYQKNVTTLSLRLQKKSNAFIFYCWTWRVSTLITTLHAERKFYLVTDLSLIVTL